MRDRFRFVLMQQKMPLSEGIHANPARQAHHRRWCCVPPK
jgi:hypothetical protein